MPQASREPINDTASPRGTRSFDGINTKVLSLAGYSLLAYALYNVVSAVLIGGFGSGPEITFSRMTQLLSIFPLLLLGPVLIFTPQGALRVRGLWPGLVRWLVFLLAVMFLLFVPVAFLNQYFLGQRDANQVKRLETDLGRRKQEIMGAIAPLQSLEAFRSTLSRFPEVTSINIAPGESAVQVRKDISTSIDRGIEVELNRLRQAQQQRLQAAAATARSVAAGSLIAGISLLGLATHLLPWLEPLVKATTHTFKGSVKAVQTVGRRFHKWRSLQPARRPRRPRSPRRSRRR